MTCWLPDSFDLIYVSVTGKVARLLHNGRRQAISYPMPSPNGKYLAFDAETWDSNLWMLDNSVGLSNAYFKSLGLPSVPEWRYHLERAREWIVQLYEAWGPAGESRGAEVEVIRGFGPRQVAEFTICVSLAYPSGCPAHPEPPVVFDVFVVPRPCTLAAL